MKESAQTSHADVFYKRNDKHEDGPSQKSDWTKPYKLNSALDKHCRSGRVGHEKLADKSSKPE